MDVNQVAIELLCKMFKPFSPTTTNPNPKTQCALKLQWKLVSSSFKHFAIPSSNKALL
jgi:hypothetical protein